MPKIEFVNEPQNQIKVEPRSASGEADVDRDGIPVIAEASDTWRGVIEAQNDLVKASSGKKGDVPSWAVAEAEEVSCFT